MNYIGFKRLACAVIASVDYVIPGSAIYNIVARAAFYPFIAVSAIYRIAACIAIEFVIS